MNELELELKSKQILHFAVRAGEIMLQSGAETYRVEDTISRILKSRNFETVETFVIPTCIIATIDSHDIELITNVKRIKNRSTRLDKISLVNTLSRKYVSNLISTEDAIAEVNNIDQVHSYSSSVIILATGMSAAFFTIMVGGNFIDFIPAFLIGLIAAIVKVWLTKRDITSYLIYFVSGFIIGSLAVTASSIIPTINIDPVIIGGIMPFVPGVAFTNSIRDMIGDEIISGLSRGIEAFFIAVSLAAGTGIAMNIFSSIGGFSL